MPQLQAAPDTSAAASIPPFDWHMLTWGLEGGLAVLFLTAAAVALAIMKEQRVRGKDAHGPTGPRELARVVVRAGRDATLPGGAKWSFSDSWATNLTALITATAALAAVLLKDLAGLFVAQAPLAYAITTSAMLAVAALAPIVYTTFQREPSSTAARPSSNVEDEASIGLQGTMLGWCLSAAVTVFAVGGSLSAAMRFSLDVRRPAGHGLGERVVCAFIVLVIVLIVVYVSKSFLVLYRAVRSGSKNSMKALVGLVTVSCCSGAEGTPQVRISIL